MEGFLLSSPFCHFRTPASVANLHDLVSDFMKGQSAPGHLGQPHKHNIKRAHKLVFPVFAACSQDAQWQLLHGLLESAIYGGRLESTYDEKVLSTYLSEFFNKELVGGGKVRV